MLKSNISHVSMADLNGQASQTPPGSALVPQFLQGCQLWYSKFGCLPQRLNPYCQRCRRANYLDHLACNFREPPKKIR